MDAREHNLGPYRAAAALAIVVTSWQRRFLCLRWTPGLGRYHMSIQATYLNSEF